MRKALFLPVVIALACCMGCANVDEETLTGPSVHDQLNSRGYTSAPLDTVMPVDTVGNALDSLVRP